MRQPFKSTDDLKNLIKTHIQINKIMYDRKVVRKKRATIRFRIVSIMCLPIYKQ